MGKIDYFHISFNKQIPVYMVGETVEGTVSCKLNDKLRINSVNHNLFIKKITLLENLCKLLI